MLAVGEVVGGKFRIDELVGRGGMGVVAIATHLQLAQKVALKVLHEPLAADKVARDRFLREAQAPNRLKSDHVCRVFDVGTLDSGAPYIVMELLEGMDLAHTGVLPIPTAIDYVLQAMVAIAEAHALGIVHRDLKPANLFLVRRIDGTPLIKVLDFGIAKSIENRWDPRLTSTTALMGSPGYMSPEQLRSPKDVDARADIWALGVILYELVSGRVPFPATSVTELAMKVATEPPDPLNVDPAYQEVVLRCLEKHVDRRYQNVAELARDMVPLGGPGAAATAALIAKLLGVAVVIDAPRPLTLPPIAATVPVAAKRKRSRTGWWLGGAFVFAGGAIAAALLVTSKTAAKPVTDAATLVPMTKAQTQAIVADMFADADADADRTVMYDVEQAKDCDRAYEDLAAGFGRMSPTEETTLETAVDGCYATRRHNRAPGTYPPYSSKDRLFDLEKATKLFTDRSYARARLQADYMLDRSENDEDAAHIALFSSCVLGDAERAHELIKMIKSPELHDVDVKECGLHDVTF